jgi:hypothetical protein
LAQVARDFEKLTWVSEGRKQRFFAKKARKKRLIIWTMGFVAATAQVPD